MGGVGGLFDAVVHWAGGQDDVRAVALVGSHVHGTATEESDVDLVIVVDDVARRVDSRSWLADFGDVRTVGLEDWGLIQSLRVRYRGGLEVEFGLAPLEWATPPLDEGTRAVVREGLRILFDPDRLLMQAKYVAVTAADGADDTGSERVR